MAKTTTRLRARTGGKSKPTGRPKRKPLSELNAWLTANHEALLKKARANCERLTGKPTFGGGGRRKSA